MKRRKFNSTLALGASGIALTANMPLACAMNSNQDKKKLGVALVGLGSYSTYILSYHLIDGTKVTSQMLVDGQTASTLQGEELTISLSSGAAVVDKTGRPANVTKADIEVLSGVIHFIDKVLLPQEVLDAL